MQVDYQCFQAVFKKMHFATRIESCLYTGARAQLLKRNHPFLSKV